MPFLHRNSSNSSLLKHVPFGNKYIHTLLIGIYLVCVRMNVGSKFRFSCDYDLELLDFEWDDVPCWRPREGAFHILQWGKDALMVPQNLSFFSFFGTDMNEGFVKSCPVFQRTHSLWMTSRARDEWQTYLLHKTLHLTWSRSPSRSSTSWDVPHLSVSFALVPSLVPCVSGWDKVEGGKIIYCDVRNQKYDWNLLDEAQHKRREVGGTCQWVTPNLRLKGWSQHKLNTMLCVYTHLCEF